jgi:DASH complex subunit SPC19
MPWRVLTITMSRLSTLPRPRESVFASGIDSYRGDSNAVCPPNLRECVLAMEDCCEEVGDLDVIIRTSWPSLTGAWSSTASQKWNIWSATNEQGTWKPESENHVNLSSSACIIIDFTCRFSFWSMRSLCADIKQISQTRSNLRSMSLLIVQRKVSMLWIVERAWFRVRCERYLFPCRTWLKRAKVEVAQAMQSKVATAPTANKREERRLQMLAKQRQRLEDEVKVLESEILALVCTFPQVMNYTEPYL